MMNVGASAVVRDMEAIRQALNDGMLNWLGLSYGTMLGAEYAERYPMNIRTLALDGALDRGLSEPQMLGDEATAAEDSFRRWATWCEGSGACALHGQNVLRVWDDLIATANRSPIHAANVDRGVTGEEMQFTADGLLANEGTWPKIGSAIVKALKGDASGFASPEASPPNYGPRAIGCLDFPVQARNFAEFTARITLARIDAPHLGGANQTGQIISECTGWPRPTVDPRHFLDVNGAPPSLIVNSTHDPSTSYVWALSMQAQIPRSVLLTRDGDYHLSYATSDCARQAIERYVINLVLPPPGTVCRG